MIRTEVRTEKLKDIPLAFAGAPFSVVTCGSNCTWDDFYGLINTLINLMVYAAIPLAVIVVLYGGFCIMTAAGDESRFQKGKDAIIGAVIGLVIVFGSYILVNFIIRALSG